MMQAQKRRLGRGLAALIGDDVAEDTVVADMRSLKHVPIELIRANPLNPRKHFLPRSGIDGSIGRMGNREGRGCEGEGDKDVLHHRQFGSGLVNFLGDCCPK